MLAKSKRVVLITIALAALSVTGGCATLTLRGTVVPIANISIPDNQLGRTMFTAVALASQDLDHSIILPNRAILEPGEVWKTDLVPLTQDLIRAHNMAVRNSQSRLPEDRWYRIQYSGSYVYHNRAILFRISPELFHGSSGSAFRPYTRSYYKQFFVDRLSPRLGAQTKAAAMQVQP